MLIVPRARHRFLVYRTCVSQRGQMREKGQRQKILAAGLLSHKPAPRHHAGRDRLSRPRKTRSQVAQSRNSSTNYDRSTDLDSKPYCIQTRLRVDEEPKKPSFSSVTSRLVSVNDLRHTHKFRTCCIRICHGPRKSNSHRPLPIDEIKASRIEPAHPPWPRFATWFAGGKARRIKLDRMRMIAVHVGDDIRLCGEQLLCP